MANPKNPPPSPFVQKSPQWTPQAIVDQYMAKTVLSEKTLLDAIAPHTLAPTTYSLPKQLIEDIKGVYAPPLKSVTVAKLPTPSTLVSEDTPVSVSTVSLDAEAVALAIQNPEFLAAVNTHLVGTQLKLMEGPPAQPIVVSHELYDLFHFFIEPKPDGVFVGARIMAGMYMYRVGPYSTDQQDDLKKVCAHHHAAKKFLFLGLCDWKYPLPQVVAGWGFYK